MAKQIVGHKATDHQPRPTEVACRSVEKVCPGGVLEQSEGDMRVLICTDAFVQFQGTRAQLESEGLVPKLLVWPNGTDSAYWEANGYTYSLKRRRPDWLKGPMKLWARGDWWSCRIEIKGHDYASQQRRSLERRAGELVRDLYRQTPEGRREAEANWRRYWASVDDRGFQSFKALIPGLISPKRGRRSRVAAD